MAFQRREVLMTRTLRVLHIASGDLWAGAEVQAFTLISNLARIPNTEVAMVVMNEGTLADKLHSADLPVYMLDEQKVASPLLLVRLCAILRTWRPDVIHTHRDKENILGSLANRLCWNVPSVRTIHGLREETSLTGLKGVRRRTASALNRWSGRTLQQRVIAVTRELGVRARSEFPAEKIVVIENGIDVEAVSSEKGISEFRAADPGATHVGIAGRLVDIKRVDLFIEAAALLLGECPQRRWRFHVFGDGPNRQALEDLSRRLQLGDKMIFHGHRPDIETCVGGLDALVICSDHEGLPMVSLEAAVLAVPTVAHAVGGLVEVVPEEFLVSRHDAVGYKDGILRILRADGRVIAAKYAADTVARFSARRNAEKVRVLYEQVLTERNGRTVKIRGAE
ncbi:MAG TPA: glycosyltransferase [Steroidobacteraceae bacterium]|nr:glycosyltransferase [Steroidobacteraceae bacterium]